MSGFRTLFRKEVMRFRKVATQTVMAPVLTSMLYLLVFSHLMEGRLRVYDAVPYSAFLVPGLVMMSMLQNAFANSSSSIIQSKMTGNIICVLLPPLSHWEFFCGYVLAAIVRGMVVGAGVLLITLPFTEVSLQHAGWVLAFALVGCGLLGTLGLIAGMMADKIDQVAAFQNFLIMPLTFLSGVFYSIHSLPPVWQDVSHLNPFFYMIDGFRYGFFGASDVSPMVSFAVAFLALALSAGVALNMLRNGYKLRF
ncbi:MAG: ABC transporter permease [Burkholderiales bacterium]